MKTHSRALTITLGVLLIISLGFIAFTVFFGGDSLLWTSYLQSPNEIYNMESGIIYNALDFRPGQDYALSYDFENREYAQLIEQYRIEETAGEGSEFERARSLMNEFSGRLTHESGYDNHIPMNALSLLEYSMDNKGHGINCRNKAQILNEMCLALGIYSRKVWIMPGSVYDGDCHVVNEIWDSKYGKWIMLDITNNMYWVDKQGTPLSVLEIRDKIARQEFCTPVDASERLDALDGSLSKNFGVFLYIAKNMVRMQYCEENTVGESERVYLLFPENINTDYEYIISREAIEAAP